MKKKTNRKTKKKQTTDGVCPKCGATLVKTLEGHGNLPQLSIIWECPSCEYSVPQKK